MNVFHGLGHAAVAQGLFDCHGQRPVFGEASPKPVTKPVYRVGGSHTRLIAVLDELAASVLQEPFDRSFAAIPARGIEDRCISPLIGRK